MIPKNYKKATKATDICPICDKGKKLIKKLDSCNTNFNFSEESLQQIRDQINIYQQHIFVKERQKRLYDDSLLRATTFSCVVIMDFKENFKIGGGPIETGQVFFQKIQVSDLGFAVYYKGVDNNLHVKYFNFMSKILSHDSLFAIDCISQLLQQPFMQQFGEFCFWSDSGPHFRSAELLHFVADRLPTTYIGKRFFLNYFTEYHGKSVVDGHFGLLSRWFYDGEATQDIKTLDDLMNFFRNKVIIFIKLFKWNIKNEILNEINF